MIEKDCDNMIKKIIKILLLILWMSLIFSLSVDNGVKSSKKSNGLVIWIGETIFQKEFTEEEKIIYIDKYDPIIRDMAHFTIFFILGVLFISILKEYHPLTKKDILWTILFVFLYAGSDEIHQLFIRERSGELLDIIIDTSGGVFSSISYYYLNKKTKKDI